MADTELGAGIIRVAVDGTDAIAGSDRVREALKKIGDAELALAKIQDETARKAETRTDKLKKLEEELFEIKQRKTLAKRGSDEKSSLATEYQAKQREIQQLKKLYADEAKLEKERADAAKNALKDLKAVKDKAAREDEARNRTALAEQKRVTEDYIRSISQMQAAQKGFGRSGQIDIAEDLRKQGLSATQLKNTLIDLEKTAGKGALTFRELSFATRSIPAQFTDIAVSLQGGQNPLTVLLQQGGQLKDMFGGVGNAARAMAGYVAGLINPVSVLGAAVASMGVAYAMGSKEADEFRKAIVLTGSAAGATVGQLAQLSREVSASTGSTVGASAEAVAALASTGKVSLTQMKTAAEALISANKYLGISVEDLVKQYADLGKSPLEATLKLNEQYNYLTLAVYEQIKALEKQGNKAGAAKIAIDELAKAQKSAADEIKNNLGYFESFLDLILSKGKKAVDVAKEIGRRETPKEEQGRLEKIQADGEDLLPSEKRRLKFLQEVNRENEKLQTVQAEYFQRQKAGMDASAELDKRKQASLTKEQILVKELAAIEKLVADVRRAGGTVDEAAIEAMRQKARDDAKEKVKEAKEQKDAYASIKKSIEDFIAVQEEELSTNEKLSAGDKLRLKVMSDLAKKGKEYSFATELQVRAELEYAESVGKSNDANKEAKKVQEDWQKSVEKADEAAQKHVETLRETAIKTEAELENYGKLKSEIEETTIARLEEQFAMVDGIDSQEVLANRLREELELRKRIRDARKGIEERDADKNAAKEADKALKEQAKAWDKFADDIEKSLTDALMRSFESGDSFGEAFAKNLQNTFKTMALKLAIQAVVDPVSGAIRGAMGIPGSTSAAGNALSGASNLFSLGNNIASGFGLTGAGAAAGTVAASNLVGAAGGDALGSLIALNSGSWGVGAAGVTGGGALSGIGTALPWVGGALAIASLLGAFDDEKDPEISLANFAPGSNAKVDERFAAGSKRFVGSPFGILRASAQHVEGEGGEYAEKLAEKLLKPVAELDKIIAQQLDKVELKEVRDVLDGWTTGTQEDSGGFSKKLEGRLDLISDTIGGTVDTIFDAFETNMKDGYALLATALSVEGDKAFEQLLLDLAGSGTSALDAVNLTEGLKTVNTTLEMLGQPLIEIGTAGAEAAKGLIEAYGGLENFTKANQTYFEMFYTEQEKLDVATQGLQDQFKELGLIMPSTNEGFRTLVESLDTTTTEGAKTDAALKSLAPTFNAVTNATNSMASAATKAANEIAAAAINIANRTASIAKEFQTAVSREEAAGIVEKAGGGSAASLLTMTPEQLNQVGLQLLGGVKDTTRDFALPSVTDLTNQVAREFGRNTGGSEFFLALGQQFKDAFTGLIDDQTISNLAYDVARLFTDETPGQDLTAAEQTVITARDTLLDGLEPVIEALKLLKVPVETAADVTTEVITQQSAGQGVDTSAFDAEANRQAGIKLNLERQILELNGDTLAIRELELAGLDDTNKALQKRIWAIQDEATALKALEANVDKALAGVRRAVDAEIDTVRKTSDELIRGWEKQVDALQANKTAANETAQSMGAMFDSIEQGVKSLRGVVDPAGDRTQARAYIDMALALAQSGVMPDQDKLADAINRVVGDDEQAYNTRIDFIRAQAVQAGKLEQLGVLVGKQKSIAEQQLEAIENQEKALRDQIQYQNEYATKQIDALNLQYIKAQEQVDVMRGIDTSVKSVAEAIKALEDAINAISIGGTTSKNVVKSTDLSASVAFNGQTVDVKGPTKEDLVIAAVTALGGNASAALSNPAFIDAWGKDLGIPGFAVGSAYVPKNMLAGIHEGEIILDPQSSDILRRYGIGLNVSSDPELIAEVATLRAALGVIASNTRQTKELLDSTINGGNTIRTEAV